MHWLACCVQIDVNREEKANQKKRSKTEEGYGKRTIGKWNRIKRWKILSHHRNRKCGAKISRKVDIVSVWANSMDSNVIEWKYAMPHHLKGNIILRLILLPSCCSPNEQYLWNHSFLIINYTIMIIWWRRVDVNWLHIRFTKYEYFTMNFLEIDSQFELCAKKRTKHIKDIESMEKPYVKQNAS